MEETQVVEIKTAGYENIYFDCPTCRKQNVLNRASDIGNHRPISYLDGVVCSNPKCGQVMSINSDKVVKAAYRWFLDELYIFIARKEYRSYILNLCQAFESFFFQAIVNKELDRNPKLRDEEGYLLSDEYNLAMKKLLEELGHGTFIPLRRRFLKTFKNEKNNFIPSKLPLKEDRRAVCFAAVKNTKLNNMRNSVVHKTAYCPSISDVESFEELVDAIYWLGMYLDVVDSEIAINFKD